ncbi:MAG: hypothetical protein Q8N18_13835 [Opitutaceae bacterium]|nr:hypothetical protein [Opitutaceae bacterium]
MFRPPRGQRGLTHLGCRDEALRALRTALQQKPDHAQARAWLQQIESAP